MAEDKPVRRTVRKTATRKVVRKTATRKRATSVRTKPTAAPGGLTLKTFLILVLVLIGGSAGAFFVGYSSDGVIDVNERFADKANYVNVSEEDFDNNELPVPQPPAFRPALQIVDQESLPRPEPQPASEPEESATSTDEMATSTSDGGEGVDAESEDNLDGAEPTAEISESESAIGELEEVSDAPEESAPPSATEITQPTEG